MATALSIIKSALRKIGVLGVGQSLSAEEAQDALDALNQMLSSWSVEGYNVYTQERETFPLSSGVASYTIGTGQTFNTTRPVEITSAFLRVATQCDMPLALIDSKQYSMVPDKSTPGYPEALFYDANFPVANIILYPTPTAGITLHLYSFKELTSFAALATNINLPPAYERALVFNLAVEIAPEYEKEANMTVSSIAKQAKRNVKVANTRTANNQALVDPALLRPNRFDIYSGQFV